MYVSVKETKDLVGRDQRLNGSDLNEVDKMDNSSFWKLN